MPVQTPNAAVAEMQPAWETVRDCVAGPRKVKAAGAKRLPKLKSHEAHPELYARYLDRALFLPVTRRSWLAFRGLAFRRPVERKVPDESILEDITLTGIGFEDFVQLVFGYQLAPGRVGLLVDMAAEQAGLAHPSRAFQRLYFPEHILDGREQSVGDASRQLAGIRHPEFQSLKLGEGAQITTQTRLMECVDEPDPKDRWAVKRVEQVRVITLTDLPHPDGGTTVGQVHQLYRAPVNSTAGDEWPPYGEPVVPRRRGVPVPFIPFVPLNATSISFELEEPPMLGMSEINLSQYKTSADLENARFKLGHPTLYAFGVQVDDKLEIGDTLWTSGNHEAHAGSVQIADGFEGLRLALVEKLEQMADEGARLMAKTEGPAETATASRIKRVGERSLLAVIADTCSQGVQQALTYQAWWNDGVASLPEMRKRVSVAVNKSFEDEFLTGAEGVAWLQVQQGYGISKDTLMQLYKRGGVYPEGRTVEDEKRLIEMDRARALETLMDDPGDDVRREPPPAQVQ